MKKIFKTLPALLVLASTLFSLSAFALTNDQEFILNNSATGGPAARLGSSLKQADTIMVQWSPSLNVSHRVSTVAVDLGSSMPPNATLVRSWLKVITPVTYVNQVGATTSTISVGCGSGVNFKTNLFAATDVRPNVTGNYIDGASGASTGFVDVSTAECRITAYSGSNRPSTGTVNFFFKYNITQ